jgi:hypothetical protein
VKGNPGEAAERCAVDGGLLLMGQSGQLEKGWLAAEEQGPEDGPGVISDVSATG